MESLQAEIAAMRLTIAEKDKTHKQEIAEKDKTIAERSLRRVKTRGFIYVDRTDSKPHCASKTHKKSMLRESKIEVTEFPDKVWDAAYMSSTEEKEFSVDSETMVVEQAVRILQALIVGFELTELVHVSTNRVVAGVELDIVLLFGSQRIPFGAIEVKKSGKEGFDDNIIFQGEDKTGAERLKQAGVTTGQHLDQLNAISLFGFQAVYGMITNGNKWMITSATEFTKEGPDRDWDLDKVLRTKEPEPNDISPEQNFLFLAESPVVLIPISAAPPVSEEECSQKTEESIEEESSVEEDMMEEESSVKSELDAVESELDSPSADGRVLYASQVVAISKDAEGQVSWENVVQLIAEFLRLACVSFSKITPKTVGNSLESCRVLDITRPSRCSFMKKTFSKGVGPGEYLFHGSTCKLIYLVASIGRGQHADCCLGLSGDGTSCCAVKFFLKQKENKRSPIKLARKELVKWKSVYGKDLPACRVGKLPNSGGYLCMPYLKPISIDQREEQTGEVKKALKRFAESGYKHNDIKWHHFGWWNNVLYMCDLGDIENMQQDKKDGGEDEWIEKWVNMAMDILEGRRVATEDTPSKASSTLSKRKRSLAEIE